MSYMKGFGGMIIFLYGGRRENGSNEWSICSLHWSVMCRDDAFCKYVRLPEKYRLEHSLVSTRSLNIRKLTQEVV